MSETKRFDIKWILRAPGKATQPPNPAYPDGIDLDVSLGMRPACQIALPYPGQGLGLWAIMCKLCGYTTACTAAGRPDDPRSITMACKLTRH